MKKGYKNTEIGVIPEEWEVNTLGEVCDVRDGTHDSPKYQDDGVKFVTSKNIINGKVDFTELKYISFKDAFEIDKRSKVDKGDIIMSMIGTIGNAVLVDFIPDFSIKNVALFKPNLNSLSFKFLIQTLHSDRFQRFIETKLAGGIQKFISLGVLRNLEIPFPKSLPEQTAIATVLSDTDALIQALEKKIAKKQFIKKGAMQVLLSPYATMQIDNGQLTGDNGQMTIDNYQLSTVNCQLKKGWVVKTLGEVCEKITTGKLDANAMVKDGTYRFYTCAKNYYFIDDFLFDTEALLVSGNGANVGYIHYYKGKFNAYQRTYVLYGFNENIQYVKLFMDKHLVARIDEQKNDGNTPYIKMDTLTDMDIYLPPIQEQTRIAQILSDMDAEIETLQKKLAKYKLLKQGLMQNLLTGRIRLI